MIEEKDVIKLSSLVRDFTNLTKKMEDTEIAMKSVIEQVNLFKEQYELLRAEEKNFLDSLELKYDKKFTTQELWELVFNKEYEI